MELVRQDGKVMERHVHDLIQVVRVLLMIFVIQRPLVLKQCLAHHVFVLQVTLEVAMDHRDVNGTQKIHVHKILVRYLN